MKNYNITVGAGLVPALFWPGRMPALSLRSICHSKGRAPTRGAPTMPLISRRYPDILQIAWNEDYREL